MAAKNAPISDPKSISVGGEPFKTTIMKGAISEPNTIWEGKNNIRILRAF